MEMATLAKNTNESPTGKLRFRQRQPSEGLPGSVLQQEWRTWEYQDGNVSSYSHEWRDVPFVADAQ